MPPVNLLFNNILHAHRTDKLSLEATLAEAQALSAAKEQVTFDIDISYRRGDARLSQNCLLFLLQEYSKRLSDLKQHLAAAERKEYDTSTRATGATRLLVRGDAGDGGEETAAGSAVGKRIPAAVAAVVTSDLQPHPISPSYPTDSDVAASQDGGSSINGDSDSFSNNNNKSLGGSSWAMVAASESRLTSTHPSTASLVDDDGAARSQHQQQQQAQHLATSAVQHGSGSGGNYHGGEDEEEPSDFRATPLSSDSLLFINQVGIHVLL